MAMKDIASVVAVAIVNQGGIWDRNKIMISSEQLDIMSQLLKAA